MPIKLAAFWLAANTNLHENKSGRKVLVAPQDRARNFYIVNGGMNRRCMIGLVSSRAVKIP